VCRFPFFPSGKRLCGDGGLSVSSRLQCFLSPHAMSPVFKRPAFYSFCAVHSAIWPEGPFPRRVHSDLSPVLGLRELPRGTPPPALQKQCSRLGSPGFGFALSPFPKSGSSPDRSFPKLWSFPELKGGDLPPPEYSFPPPPGGLCFSMVTAPAKA